MCDRMTAPLGPSGGSVTERHRHAAEPARPGSARRSSCRFLWAGSLEALVLVWSSRLQTWQCLVASRVGVVQWKNRGVSAPRWPAAVSLSERILTECN